MLRHDVKNHNTEQDENGLSRRRFFSRIAVGAALSIALPGMAQAAKNTTVKKEDKPNHHSTPSSRSAVRLPKQVTSQDRKATNKFSKTTPHHTTDKNPKVLASKTPSESFKTRLPNNHTKPAHVEHNQTHALHASHHGDHASGRVRDVYNHPSKSTIITRAVDHKSHNRSHSVIHTAHRDSILDPGRTPLVLADHSRLNSHRSLTVQNPHTGDKLSLTYFEQGRYLNDALNEISFLLRDYRTGDVHPVDPELLDQLHDLKQMLGIYQPFDVICGYRSPLTNARLHAEHSGVANNSFHMHGRAVDIRVERFDLRRIHNAALAMHRGGVGYYPESNFIHLDTGTFRTWTF